jgi:hypothetical protein
VYCDTTTAGGGWTLVARTTDRSAARFGWNEKTGSVDDDVNPYVT